MTAERQAISGPMADLYDVFVDWEGRLGRELPGLTKHLERVNAEKVLDAGCGTGRHVAALRAAGYDAHGSDVSEDMLGQARELLGGDGRLHAWRLGDAPPDSLKEAAPFDALVSLGNVWPHVLEEDDLKRTGAALLDLLRPGGLVLIGLKALAVRRETGNPYMPLLKRERNGAPLWFVRFLDFTVPPLEDGTEVCGFHMVVTGESEHHRESTMRVWSPEGLARWFTAAGFAEVRVSGRLDDPDATPVTEDVFVVACKPGRVGARVGSRSSARASQSQSQSQSE